MDDDIKTKFKREIDAITTIRDELKLKAHLAKSDVKDEFDRLELKFDQSGDELKRTKAHAQDEVKQLGENAKELLADLKQGYENVKRKLS